VAGTGDHVPVLRPHRVAIGCYREGDDGGLERAEQVELDVTGARTRVEALVGADLPPLLLVNDGDLTYAKVRLDPATTQVVTDRLASVRDPLARAQLWASTWDMVRDAEMPAHRYLDLVVANVASEPRIGTLQRLLARAIGAVERYVDPTDRSRHLARLARHARAELEAAAPGSDRQLAWARHWAVTSQAEEEHRRDVERLLDGERSFDGLAVDADLRWHLLTCLARAGAEVDHRIDAELERDPTDLGVRSAATARASRPLPAAKEEVWEQLLEDPTLSHTMSRQLWSGFARLDQGEILHPFTERYFTALERVWAERSLDWAIDFSAAMFPHWDASDDLLARVDEHLGHPDLPRPLRRVLLEQRDTLVRTLSARKLDRDAG